MELLSTEAGGTARAGMLVKLRPSRPWRIGPASAAPDRVDLIYHSDTLFSAITHAMRLLGRLEYWLEVTARRTASGEGGPLIRFTSMFPFFGDTLYVTPPRHIWPPALSVRVHYAGARFIPLQLVESIFAGKPIQDDRWTVDGASACLVPTGKTGPFRIGVRSSAAVDRLSGAAAPHRTACLEFVPKAGMWFAISFADAVTRDQWSDPLRAAIRLLADSGFGGERSRGWGRTHAPEFRDGPVSRLIYRSAPAADYLHWNLALVSPAESDQVEWDRGSYSTTVRGGRIDSPHGSGAAKKLLTMIEEGSVLSATVLEGNAPDVAPEGFGHPVYHAGWAFSIPVPSEVPKQIEIVEEPAQTEALTEPTPQESGGLDFASAPESGDDISAEAIQDRVSAVEEEPDEEGSPEDTPPEEAPEDVVDELMQAAIEGGLTAGEEPDIEAARQDARHEAGDEADDAALEESLALSGEDTPAASDQGEIEIPTSDEKLERLSEAEMSGPEDPDAPPLDDPGPMEAPFREPDDLAPDEIDPEPVETPPGPNPDEPRKPEEPVE